MFSDAYQQTHKQHFLLLLRIGSYFLQSQAKKAIQAYNTDCISLLTIWNIYVPKLARCNQYPFNMAGVSPSLQNQVWVICDASDNPEL